MMLFLQAGFICNFIVAVEVAQISPECSSLGGGRNSRAIPHVCRLTTLKALHSELLLMHCTCRLLQMAVKAPESVLHQVSVNTGP